MGRLRVPDGAFELALQVRSYEVGREGYVRPANVLRYFEYLATEASTARGFDHSWYEQHGSAWVVREMWLVAGVLPGIGERLRMATWLSSVGRVQAYREYALWREVDSRLIARAQGRWAYVDRETTQLRRIPEELIARFGALGDTMPQRHFPSATDALGMTPPLDVAARTYETDSQQHINNAVYMDWLEEQTALALPRATDERSWVPHLRRVHLEYLRPVLPGHMLQVHVEMSRTGHLGYCAEYRIAGERDGSPAVRAHALYLCTHQQSDSVTWQRSTS